MKHPNQTLRKRTGKKRLISPRLTATLLALVVLGLGTFSYLKYQSVVKDPQKQIEQKNSKETQQVINRLGKILRLPSDAQPTVAKVEDVEKLKKSNPTFYKDIAAEDYLILYSDRAIIYRSKENKIINIAPIIDTTKTTPNETDNKTTN